jgi:hypothetical protein
MSNGVLPIEPAPVPPSVPGVPQPVFGSGSATLPTVASWFPSGTTGDWMPPPQVGMGGNAPSPTPVVPPGTGVGIPQPVFGSGSATVPTAASLFPSPTTISPSPPIVFANIAMIGAGAPPSTPTTPVIPTLAEDADLAA